ncbi:MAG: hypothetical protein ACR2MC_09435 [Actinomycetota bacterium]
MATPSASLDEHGCSIDHLPADSTTLIGLIQLVDDVESPGLQLRYCGLVIPSARHLTDAEPEPLAVCGKLGD